MKRLPAEWEKQSAVQLTFPHEHSDWASILDEVIPCFVEIVNQITRFEPVLLVCREIDEVKPYFTSEARFPIHWVELPSNDTWARDHGGITIIENQQPVILDFVFNGWGLKFPADKDNLITQQLVQMKHIGPSYEKGGMVLEGGGIESDGEGTILTTAECLLSPNRNPHLSKEEIELLLHQKFGSKRLLWLHHGFLAGDDTDSHIDTLARFCSPDTIAYVRCDKPDDEHFSELSLMEKELMSFQQLNGQPYNLVPLPWPEACLDEEGNRLPATYANFLIINGAVLVPTYGVPQDGPAIQVIKSIFPDREVIGINCRVLIEQHGSLHCVTMQYPEGALLTATTTH
jgi:agmatine deiminase